MSIKFVWLTVNKIISNKKRKKYKSEIEKSQYRKLERKYNLVFILQFIHKLSYLTFSRFTLKSEKCKEFIVFLLDVTYFYSANR